MGGTYVAEPKMLAATGFAATSIERRVDIQGNVSARNSLPSRKERKGEVQVGLAHLCNMNRVQSFSSIRRVVQEDSKNSALRGPNNPRSPPAVMVPSFERVRNFLIYGDSARCRSLVSADGKAAEWRTHRL